ncbi:hypothetical protein P7K49_003950 [Saguinus oedipus]|uniref:Uncharacterized protein n=1 Tax=Saguinus oedipus TaxID=9490 RepID=A0ABQ9W5Z6_SAGOE|nr:hypothetical protein P7K49_003950 [Saguinus oedipus]
MEADLQRLKSKQNSPMRVATQPWGYTVTMVERAPAGDQRPPLTAQAMRAPVISPFPHATHAHIRQHGKKRPTDNGRRCARGTERDLSPSMDGTAPGTPDGLSCPHFSKTSPKATGMDFHKELISHGKRSPFFRETPVQPPPSDAFQAPGSLCGSPAEAWVEAALLVRL